MDNLKAFPDTYVSYLDTQKVELFSFQKEKFNQGSLYLYCKLIGSLISSVDQEMALSSEQTICTNHAAKNAKNATTPQLFLTLFKKCYKKGFYNDK